MELLEFYPTPVTLLNKILEGVDWRKVGTVLEPSAGKGDIVRYISEKADSYPYYNNHISIDCVELDETLRNTLEGAEYRVVYDDFLKFKTFKRYDIIISNPPFSNADVHLTKMLDMQEATGGDVICIVNAETIRNPYTSLRKALVNRLENIGAQIEYMTEEFASAERTTNVEIAVVKVHYEKPKLVSNIFEGLKKKAYAEAEYAEDLTELAPNDFVEAIVKAYELEIEAGITLINEYRALEPRIMSQIKSSQYDKPLLELKSNGYDLSVNSYVEHTRLKYWEALFADHRITGQMTNNLAQEFRNKVNELKDFEFNTFNIRKLQNKMSRNLVDGIERCIIELFDDLSIKYAHNPEFSQNIWLYNGWKTNSAYKINKKVIIPFYGAFGRWYSDGKFDPLDYDCYQKLSDIEKALNYLDGGRTCNLSLHSCLAQAKEKGQNKKIRTKFLELTFYKKGTCHITFLDDELLKKFNIFGSRKKGWLPQTYGKKPYSQMEAEEKAVIDEFEGEASYNATMADTDYYLFDSSSIPLIESATNAA